MKKYGAVFLAAAALGSALPARALFFNAGASQTTGSRNYSGTRVYADFGDSLHVRPSFSAYHSDSSSGTYKTISARIGYDLPFFGVGLTAGGSPTVNGYGNTFFGADAVVSLSPTGSGPIRRIKASEQGGGKARGKGVARVDLGAGLLYTAHRDDLQAGGARRSRAVSVGQTDLGASLGVSFLGNLASADLTKSVYDRDLRALSLRPAQTLAPQGLAAVIQGFPNTSAHLQFEMGMLPLVSPFVSYTRTTFELGEPSLNAYALGAYAELMMVEVSASYQRYAQSGRADRNYFGLGASLRF
ncbi:MAG: hypothetical protein HY921_01405 [Elusimicrobia bacterium]|nr:hypothetical protein [Elusimicrobiota bacterium]